MSKKKKNSPENENIEVTDVADDVVVETAEDTVETVADTEEQDVAPKSSTVIMPTKGVHVDEAEKEAYLEQLRKTKKRKKIITTVVVLFIVLVAVFIVYNIAFGGNSDDIVFPEGKGIVKSDASKSLGAFTDGVVCTRGDYTLSYNVKNSAFEVKKKNTPVFRSYPAPLGDESTDGGATYSSYHELISSPILVEFTKTGSDDGARYGINEIDPNPVLNKISNGLQIIYNILPIECELCVEFVLTEEGALEVFIPANGIKEKEPGEDDDLKEMPRLLSVTVFPYMCSARSGDNGYYVTPDGSGALTYFDVSRVHSNTEYSKRIYGFDETFDVFNSPDYNNEDVCIPAFGFVNNTKDKVTSFVSHKIITAFASVGEASAEIIMGNPGIKENFNFFYLAYQFNFRESYYDKLSKDEKNYMFYEEKLSVGDMKEIIYFDTTYEMGSDEKTDLYEGGFSYVDVALKTKEFLKDKWNIDKSVSADKADFINLKVLMGSENTQSTSWFSQVKVMTTFSDVRDICEDLKSNGVEDVRFSLLGWQNNGYYGNTTDDKYDIESDFGGESDLEDLLTWADKNNVVVSADNNLLKLYAEPAFGISMRNSLVKEPGTNYVMFKIANSAGVFPQGLAFYYMSPLYFDEEFLHEDIEEIKELGFKNVDLQQVGDLLFTDYNPKNALLRQQALNYYQDWINEYKKSFNEVSVYYGFDYAVKDADILLDIPTESSNLFYIDEAIPFMQLVYHGMIDYYCEPINRKDHPEVAFLKAIEYGCMFSYEITKENTEELKYTFYNDLFKSEYNLLFDDIAKADKVADEVLTNIRTANMINHYCVDVGMSTENIHKGNVYCTEYDNGCKVYVNYGSSDYTVSDGVVVPSMNYLLVK